MRIARIRLSDKTSRLRPRHVVPKPAETYEPEMPVKVREWIALRQNVLAADLVVEGVEAVAGFCLRFRGFGAAGTRPPTQSDKPPESEWAKQV